MVESKKSLESCVAHTFNKNKEGVRYKCTSYAAEITKALNYRSNTGMGRNSVLQ